MATDLEKAVIDAARELDRLYAEVAAQPGTPRYRLQAALEALAAAPAPETPAPTPAPVWPSRDDERDYRHVMAVYGIVLRRCAGDRLIYAGHMCPHCGADNPREKCKAPRDPQKSGG